MNKIIIFFFILLFSFNVSAQDIILPENPILGIPSEIYLIFEPKENLSILLEFNDSIEFLDWKILNYDYKNVRFYIVNQSFYKWTFLNSSSNNITLSYKILSTESKAIKINTVFSYLTNEKSFNFNINFRNASKFICGNFVCEENENYFNCQIDCPFICGTFCQIAIILGIITLIIIGYGRRKIRIKKPLR